MRESRQCSARLVALLRPSPTVLKFGLQAMQSEPRRAITRLVYKCRPNSRHLPFFRRPVLVRFGYFSSRQNSDPPSSKSPVVKSLSVIALSALFVYSLYTTDISHQSGNDTPDTQHGESEYDDHSVWSKVSASFEGVTLVSQTDLDAISNKVLGLMPEWSKSIPAYVRKLQRELTMGPGTLADEVWQEAHDATIHPEILYEAKVRVAESLCEEEKTFLSRRKKVVASALARYLDLDPDDVHPDDVPVIAMCGSGGGIRALVAGAGSFQATAEDGLFDCTTYISGVSGSCWLQTLYFSSLAERNLHRVIDHLKARIGIHIAYPPVAFGLLTAAPTNKYILSSIVERLKGDPTANVGLVDVYGMLLAARLLVPKGELGVDVKDFKLSNQQEYVRYGQNPLPIYTAVRHEIPGLGPSGAEASGSVSEGAKEVARKEAWFQWFEMTPYELFCEEFGAGIPTWAMGRRFRGGVDEPIAEGLRLPETRVPPLLGIWGSAFCATLSHYYREVRPFVKTFGGLQAIDDLIWGHNEDLSKVHPIDPATLPNFVYCMHGKLPKTVPETIYDNEYLQLMDAGMSNNLPIYPLLRPGREVEIVIAFDASADIKTDNWLSVVEGYTRQRGIKGWPVGIGWPKPSTPPPTVAKEMDQAQAETSADAEEKLLEAKVDQAVRHTGIGDAATKINSDKSEVDKAKEAARELGYCTVWVGRTEERSSDPPPPPIDDASSWRLMEPDAGIAVVYLPFLANEAVPGVDPATSDYMSTWNFVYTPEQIDNAVSLARANYAEGKAQIQATVRAVYERKKKRRLENEGKAKMEKLRRKMRLGIVGKLGEGDHFS